LGGTTDYPHNLDRLQYVPITDPEERVAALLRGDLDLLIDPPPSALDRLKNSPGLMLAQGNDLRTVWRCLDQSRAELRSSNVKGNNPFKDRRVRQAIYQAPPRSAARAGSAARGTTSARSAREDLEAKTVDDVREDVAAAVFCEFSELIASPCQILM
jgi:ABC-type transport system substrate-binding protein